MTGKEMGYREALEAAGATVLEFEEFGSYQGDWLALVEFKGQCGFVKGAYGSCSGCDAFEDEIGYGGTVNLAEFGARYLEEIITDEQIGQIFMERATWSLEDKQLVEWAREVYYKHVLDQASGAITH